MSEFHFRSIMGAVSLLQNAEGISLMTYNPVHIFNIFTITFSNQDNQQNNNQAMTWSTCWLLWCTVASFKLALRWAVESSYIVLSTHSTASLSRKELRCGGFWVSCFVCNLFKFTWLLTRTVFHNQPTYFWVSGNHLLQTTSPIWQSQDNLIISE